MTGLALASQPWRFENQVSWPLHLCPCCPFLHCLLPLSLFVVGFLPSRTLMLKMGLHVFIRLNNSIQSILACVSQRIPAIIQEVGITLVILISEIRKQSLKPRWPSHEGAELELEPWSLNCGAWAVSMAICCLSGQHPTPNRVSLTYLLTSSASICRASSWC